MRTDLIVPFSEKDDAKKLGAKWDPEKKVWWVSDDVDLNNFERWLPQKLEPDFKSSDYWVAEVECKCWKCQSDISVVGILLNSAHESKHPDDRLQTCLSI